MSLESKLGRRVYDLKDVLKAGIIEDLLEYSQNYDPDDAKTLTRVELAVLRVPIENSIDKIFDRGMHNILSVLKEKS